MEQEIEAIPADKLRLSIHKEQVKLVYAKILQSAKNFRFETYISSDFLLNENTMQYFRELGYEITASYIEDKEPYKYNYYIKWN